MSALSLGQPVPDSVPVPGSHVSPLVLATDLGSARGGLAVCAAVAVEIGTRVASGGSGVVVVEVSGARARPPTLLATQSARALEDELRTAGLDRVAARGRLCWLCLDPDGDVVEGLGLAAAAPSAALLVVSLPPGLWTPMLDSLRPSGALLRADPRKDRALAALAVGELRERGVRVRVATRPLGRVGSRRAIAGLEPGGPAARRIARLARGLVPPRARDEIA